MQQANVSTPPPYRVHKASQQAYILYQGKRVYLGKADKPETLQAYSRLSMEMAANGGMLRPKGDEATVDEICAHYWKEAEVYYRAPVGVKPSGSLLELKLSMQPLIDNYGATLAKDLGPFTLKAVRDTWLKQGISRTSINKRANYIKRMVRWAAENELIPAATWHAVQCVSNLKRGRTQAPEPRKVPPVPLSHVEMVKPYLSSVVIAMIDLQLCTGARPGEIAGLRAIDIDVSGAIWIATVERHKTAYTGAERKIYIGPKGQAILKPFMARRPLHATLFSPKEAEAERHAKAESHRRPDQKPNPRQTDRTVGDTYDTRSYRHAITRAMEKVNKQRLKDKLAELTPWAPNQLRHNFATLIRKQFDLEGAQVLLGHSDADITQVYAEKDEKKALSIIAVIG